MREQKYIWIVPCRYTGGSYDAVWHINNSFTSREDAIKHRKELHADCYETLAPIKIKVK